MKKKKKKKWLRQEAVAKPAPEEALVLDPPLPEVAMRLAAMLTAGGELLVLVFSYCFVYCYFLFVGARTGSSNPGPQHCSR